MKVFIIIKEISERIPKKNFQLLGDLPLWKHLVKELQDFNVYIDTDSKLVLNECVNINNIIAYPRKQKFIDFENGKLSPALLMIDNFLDTFVKDDNEIIVTTHVTSPFLKKKTILDAVNILKKGPYDSIHSVTKHQEFSWLEDNMKPINFEPNVVQKTQDLPSIIMSNGGFFIFRKKTFKQLNNRIGNNPYYYPLSIPESIEIDNYDDLNLARLVKKGLCN